MNYDFLITGDLQLTRRQPRCRTDDFPVTQYNKFLEVLSIAKIYGVKGILQPGDFWDYAAPGYGLYSLYAGALRRYLVKVFVVRGQHDLFFHSLTNIENTALNALESENLVTVLGKKSNTIKSHSGEIIQLYGSSWGEGIPTALKSPRLRRSGLKTINVLVTHESIAPKEAARGGYKPDSPEKFLKKCRENDYQLVVVGDYHAPFSSYDKNVLMVNVGCMVRLKADDVQDPRVALWSSSKPRDLKWIELKHKDVSEVISRDHIAVDNRKLEMVKEFLEELNKEGQIRENKGFIDIVKGILKGGKNLTAGSLSEGAAGIIKEGIDRCSKEEEGKIR